MPPLLFDPIFYLVAIPSVLLIGLSKGGFGGAMGQIGVPLMALAVSPVQAAAIILPILLVMDAVSLWTWRGERDNRTLKIMLPGAVAGITLGWMTAALVTADMVRLLVGAVALAFFLRWLWQRLGGMDHARPHNAAAGLFWGTVSGFTSFVAHAGGPPYQVYALPLKQNQRLYNGTSVIFFAAINAIKLLPYYALGQFDTTNLSASLVLMPLAPLATLAGAWLVKRMTPATFHTMMYCLILIVAVKLIYDGATGLAG
jgi:uncharacterized protein